MTRGVRWYLVGSFVLVSLSGCGHGFFQAEREPWRAEAELACLKSGAVKEGPDVVRIEPISGPGMCGADYPLKISAFGEGSGAFGYTDETLRPPANIGNQPRWPISQPPPPSYPQNSYPPSQTYPENAVRQPGYSSAPGAPISLTAPGVPHDEDEIDLPPDGTPGARAPYSDRSDAPPRLGSPAGNAVGGIGAVAVKPAATLACPIVSVLDRWLSDSVQPAAQRWFGSRVVEIRQISAYSCRGMNGNANAHISEHAFGNALDIAAFTLADGRRITVKDGWHGLPEEQGFLRDVQGAACQRFNTVLAPGSNVYHYDHIHVDLMRRATRRLICEPAPVSGEEIAARANRRSPYASRDPAVTGSLGGHEEASRKRKGDEDDEDE
jgi:hypothetical protein